MKTAYLSNYIITRIITVGKYYYLYPTSGKRMIVQRSVLYILCSRSSLSRHSVMIISTNNITVLTIWIYTVYKDVTFHIFTEEFIYCKNIFIEKMQVGISCVKIFTHRWIKISMVNLVGIYLPAKPDYILLLKVKAARINFAGIIIHNMSVYSEQYKLTVDLTG